MEPAVQKRRSSGNVLTLVSSQPEPQPPSPPKKRRIRTYLKVGFGILVVVAALVGTGLVVYQQAQEKVVRKKQRHALQIARLDTPLALRRSLQVLDKLQADRPGDGRIAVARAEILAMLWGRYEGSESSRRAALDALKRARKDKADPERVSAVAGDHLLFEGRYAEAARHAEAALLMFPKSARLGYVLGVARYYLGDLTAAEATLRLAASQDPRFLPVRVALARVQRQRGRLKAAERTLKELLARSPRHLEGLLEEVLLKQARHQRDSGATLVRLERQASPYPPVLAIARLALARQALRQGEIRRARELLQQAALAAPDDPEIGLALMESRLGPGGDAREAWSLRSRVAERSREYARTPMVLAQVALAVGRPDEAMKFLRRPATTVPSPRIRATERIVSIRAAWELDQAELADRECSEVFRAVDPRPSVVETCLVHTALQRDRAQLKTQQKKRTGRLGRLARALRHYARYQFAKAVDTLTPLVRAPNTSPRTLLLLAKSLQEIERPSAALPFLKRAVWKDASSVRTRLALARGLLLANHPEAATKRFHELLNGKPVGARTLLDLGRIGLRLGRLKEVQRIATRIARLHRTSGHAAYLQGAVLLCKPRTRRGARSRFEAALMLEPGHLLSTLALARLAFDRGDLDGGRSLFDEAYRRSGHSPEVTRAMARAYFAHRQVRRARWAYVRAALQYRLLGARYRSAEVLAELGHRLSGNKRYRHRSVMRILKWALKLSPRPARAHLRMGQFLEARGRIKEALAAYRLAARHGPELALAFYHLGSLLLAAHRDPRQAEQALGRFLDLTRDPNGRRARNAQTWLVRIQKRRRYLERRR